jgi:alkanesulfonate monooxygenase SsuD/methylene tetrahydromethanopterin reductase-like flavin-dependent oxidoreductase (luciferase family)
MPGFLAGLHPQERAGIAEFHGAAVIGGPDRVRDGLLKLKQATVADEMILVSDVFDPALRQRSLEITAGFFAE